MSTQGDVSEGLAHPFLVVRPVAHFLTPGAILLLPDIQYLELQIHHLQDMPWPSLTTMGYEQKRDLFSFQAQGNRLQSDAALQHCSGCNAAHVQDEMRVSVSSKPAVHNNWQGCPWMAHSPRRTGRGSWAGIGWHSTRGHSWAAHMLLQAEMAPCCFTNPHTARCTCVACQ